jgi:hypothetical protein
VVLALTGLARESARPTYAGRWVAAVIDYKIVLKSHAGSSNYGKDCKYQIDKSTIKVGVYGPQNIGYR